MLSPTVPGNRLAGIAGESHLAGCRSLARVSDDRAMHAMPASRDTEDMLGQQRHRWAAVAARVRAANTCVVDSAVAAVVAVPVAAQFSNVPPGGLDLLGVLLNAGTVLPLIWRRRAPFAVAVTVAAFAVGVSVYHRPGQDLQYGALIATYTIADLGNRWQRRSFLGFLVLFLGPGALLVKHYAAPEFLLTLLLPLSAYILGALARTSRARAAALRERAGALQEQSDQLMHRRAADVARAAAEERARIARDMHDVLAHAVAIMVVQAEAGPVVVRADPDRAERTFDTIAEAGRDAMVQLRVMLGVLKGDRDAGTRAPPPSVAAVAALVARMDRTSLRVGFRSEGQPHQLPVVAEVAAYRIVQEALTNAVKHAGADSATVRLVWADTDLIINVSDDGRGLGDTVAASAVGGHGLIGIRERVAACGGVAEAGPAPGGGFQLTARLPYTNRAATGVALPVLRPDGTAELLERS
jgi:signal transduction histidine kinase